MCSRAEMCQPILIDPLFVVSFRLPFNLGPILEVKEYYEGQNLTNRYQ